MVKKLEWIEMAQLAVSSILFQSLSLSSYSTYNPPSTTRSMRSERVQNDLGATAGLRYRNGGPRTSFTERIPYIITRSATIRAKAIGSCFLCRRGQEGTREQCCAENDWAAC